MKSRHFIFNCRKCKADNNISKGIVILTFNDENRIIIKCIDCGLMEEIKT